METTKAANAIFLDEGTPGKGRYFKSRFLETGLVKYSFGVCLLTKEVADKFVYQFVGCPVVIDHKEVTKDNQEKTSQGNICHVWYDANDGWYWCDGIIDKQEAIDCINEGYSVSCQYKITEYEDNEANELHNGNEFDKTILNGRPEHLAIVKNPRYENALIAMNAICKNNFKEQDHPRDNKGRFTDDSNNINLNFDKEIEEIIQKAKSGNNTNSAVIIGNVDKKLIEEAQKQGIDLSGYKHNIDIYGIKHSLKEHSDKTKEEQRGQVPIKEDDIKKAKEYVYNYDKSSFGEKNNQGRDVIKLYKQMSDGCVLYIEEIRTGRHTLTLNSMRKYKNKIGASNTLAGVTRHVWNNTDTNIIPKFKSFLNPNVTKNYSILEKFKKEFWENLKR